MAAISQSVSNAPELTGLCLAEEIQGLQRAEQRESEAGCVVDGRTDSWAGLNLPPQIAAPEPQRQH
jgi:hypothetical protein